MGPVNPRMLVFDAPKQNTDGSALAISAITGFEYGFGQAPGQYTKVVKDTDLSPDANGKQIGPLDLTGFAFGQWYVAGRTLTKDAQSAWSDAIPFTVEAKVPAPPANFSLG